MSVVIQTAVGILIAGAISGLVVVAVRHGNEFRELLDRLYKGILGLAGLGLLFCLFGMLTNYTRLAAEIRDHETISSTFWALSGLMTAVAWMGYIIVGLIALTAFFLLLGVLNKIFHPPVS